MAKKKVLLLCDNIDAMSGVANVARDIVLHTSHIFDWVQIAGGSRQYLNQKVNRNKDIVAWTGLEDASFTQYPVSKYGDPEILRQVIHLEKPDIIFHITDPRYWIWLYEMEYELRQEYNIPISYYAIWDNYPVPKWNASSYNSVDQIISISKLSHDVHTQLTDPNVANVYIPHGVDENVFYPITVDEDLDTYNDLEEVRQEFYQKHKCSKIFFWNNVNMRRKRPAEVMAAFKQFCDKSPEYKRESCLVMHTSLSNAAGTDLLTVKRDLYSDYNIVFSTTKVGVNAINVYYNLATAVLNIAYNEGFGLSNLEAQMAGSLVITNQTGGLIDQSHTPSTYKVHPKLKQFGGTPTTPYIYQDLCSTEDIASGLEWAYSMPEDEKSRYGKLSREMLIQDGMTSRTMASKIGMNLLSQIDKGPKQEKCIITTINGND